MTMNFLKMLTRLKLDSQDLRIYQEGSSDTLPENSIILEIMLLTNSVTICKI